MTAVIRPADPADAARLHVLMREFYEIERLRHAPHVAAALERMLAAPELGHAWLMEAEDQDAGYLLLTWGYSLEFGGVVGLVDELYVRPAYRGAGLGRRALETAVAACRRHGAGAIRLEVDQVNVDAARLYGRLGFTVHDRHIMTLRLDD